MKSIPAVFLAATSAFSFGASASTSFGFEDLTVPAHTDAITVPVGYAGATFDGFYLRHAAELQYTGLNSNDTSEILAIAIQATPSIQFAAPVAFDGAFLINPRGSFSYELYLGTALVASSGAIGVNASFLPSGYAGAIDRIVFHQAANANFSLDDLTLSPVSAPVPEPQTWALMLAGLAALGGLTRRAAALR